MIQYDECMLGYSDQNILMDNVTRSTVHTKNSHLEHSGNSSVPTGRAQGCNAFTNWILLRLRRSMHWSSVFLICYLKSAKAVLHNPWRNLISAELEEEFCSRVITQDTRFTLFTMNPWWQLPLHRFRLQLLRRLLVKSSMCLFLSFNLGWDRCDGQSVMKHSS